MWELPKLISGESVIAREELVPFFNFQSQFMDQLFGESSELTSTDEVRIGYTFWFSWVRYYQFLPIALVVVNSLSAFFLFLSFWNLTKYYAKQDSRVSLVAAFVTAFLIHFILLHSKITHFYTLVIGFSMFSLALSLFIEQLFLRHRLAPTNVAAVILLVLFNPAIHYHVLFYMVAVILFVLYVGMLVFVHRTFTWYAFVRAAVYCTWVFMLSVMPYALLILFITTNMSSSVSDSIPTSYWTIYYASMPLSFLFSLDSPSHVDLYMYGDYLLPVPRYAKILLSILPISLVLLKPWKNMRKHYKGVFLVLLILLVLSLFMSTGYLEFMTFHNALKTVSMFLYESDSPIASILSKIIYTFINILRQPHRFQFIHFFVIGSMLSIFLASVMTLTVRQSRRVTLAVLLVITALALVLNRDYRAVIISGDFDGFLKPYQVPADLQEIRTYLHDNPQKKLFVLPTLESGRSIAQQGHEYSFLDKLLIYYLNYPTYYYGTGSKTENKITAFLVYRALLNDKAWWSTILRNTLDISYVLVPKHLTPSKGLTYLPAIDEKIVQQLEESQDFTKVVDGESFTLYEATQTIDSRLFVNVTWVHLLTYLENTDFKTNKLYFPQQLRTLTTEASQFMLYTDNTQKSFYDIYSSLHPESFTKPDTSILPFTTAMTDSSLYTYITFNMMYLYAAQNQYNHLKAVVPGLITMRTPGFVSLNPGNSQTTMKLRFSIADSGRYRLLLRGASQLSSFSAKVNTQAVLFQQIVDTPAQMHLDFEYYFSDLELSPGKHEVILSGNPDHALLIEGITVIPSNNLPYNWQQEIISPVGIELRQLIPNYYFVDITKVQQ